MKKLSKDYARKVDGYGYYQANCPICGTSYGYSYNWFTYILAVIAVDADVRSCLDSCLRKRVMNSVMNYIS